MGKKKKLRTMIITFCASMVIFSQFVYAYTYSDYGTSGYNYYASVKPSLLQAGTDSVRLTFSAE